MVTARSQTRGRVGRTDLPDPVYFVWRKLTSVRFAVLLILTVALFALAAVIIPQVPPQFTSDGVRIQAHVDAQRGTWGPLTNILADFPWVYDAGGGIFNLFNQPYWYALIVVLGLSITTCTVSRFPPVWRTVRRPQRRVNDAYFERARHRFDFATPADADAVISTLRSRRFHVRVEERDGATYLFADRFSWAHLSTFAMHLALIMLVLGTLLTKFGGEEYQFWVGEGQSWPLFATAGDRQQIQIVVDDVVALFNDNGQALDFRSIVHVTSGGEEIAAGEVTVNGPLSAGGYRVHQAAYWEHGAALQVRDAQTEQLLYSETLFLEQQFFGPRVRLSDAQTGTIFAEEVIQVPQEIADLPGSGYTIIPLSDARSVALALVPDEVGEMRFLFAVIPAAIAARDDVLTTIEFQIDQPEPVAPRLRLYDANTGALLVEDVVSLDLSEGAGGTSARLGVLPVPQADGAVARIAVGYEESLGTATDLAADREFFYFNLDRDDERGVLALRERVRIGAVELEYAADDRDLAQYGELVVGEAQRIGDVELAYQGAESVFFTVSPDLPGSEEVLVLLERFGQARTAEEFNARGGENVALARTTATSAGGEAARPSRLGIGLGTGQARVDLDEGASVQVGDYEYTYLGPREFTGFNVRRDPGAIIFWIAIILGVGALLITFFVPRRRVWAKITPERTYLAGLAGHGVALRRELRHLAHAAGAPDVMVTTGWDVDGEDA